MTPRLASLAAFLLLAAAARADVDVELGKGDKVRGTLSAGETETFRVRIPKFAAITLSAKAKHGGLGLRLVAPNGTVQVDQPASPGPHTAKSNAFETGEFQVIVFRAADEDATDDYKLTVSWFSQPRFGANGDFGLGQSSFPVDAEAGARYTWTAHPAKDSPARPRLVRLERDSEIVHEFAPPADPQAVKHKGTFGPIPATDRYTMVLVDGTGAGGAWSVDAKFKRPKPSRRKVDVTASALGTEGTTGVAQGSLVGAEGGLAAFSLGGTIDGASVDVPPGALSFPTSIIVGTSPAIEVLDGALGNAGPAVLFGPEGLKFDAPVQITLPVNLGAIANPSALVVYTRDAKGKVTLVPPPYALDAAAGTITFPVLHFSSFQVFERPAPLADVNGDGIDDLLVMEPTRQGGGVLGVFFGGPRVRRLGTKSIDDADAIAGPDLLRAVGTFAAADIDGDGIAEVIVSVGFGNGGAEPAVRVYRGGAGIADRLANGTFSVLDTPGFDFVERIAAGDLDGDGVNDLVLTSRSGGGAAASGIAFFLKGVRGSLPSVDLSTVPAVLGVASGDDFGQSVAVGDVNADGIADVAIGAPQNVQSTEYGYVFVFPGSPTFFANVASASPVLIDGNDPNYSTGVALAVGDANLDGRGDLVIGDVARMSVTTPGGLAHVFVGNAGFGNATPDQAEMTVPTDSPGGQQYFSLAIARFRGTSPGAIATSLFVGSAVADDTANGVPQAGVLRRYDLRNSDGLFSTGDEARAGGAMTDFFGVIHEPLDWDGDGSADLAVGSPGNDTVASGAGLVVVFFGDTLGVPAVRIHGTEAGGALGTR